MNKVNISDEEGRVPITDISIFDGMSEEEAEIVFGEDIQKMKFVNKIISKMRGMA